MKRGDALFFQQKSLWTEDGQSGPSGQDVLQHVVEGYLIPSAVVPVLLLQMKEKFVLVGELKCDCVTSTDVKVPIPRKST